MTKAQAHISVRNLTMAYGSYVIQRDLNFDVQRGEIFAIMGGSGCGKSTLLRHLIGLKKPARGQVLYGTTSLWDVQQEERETAPHLRHVDVDPVRADA